MGRSGLRGYYAVRNGRVPGVYNSWTDCEKQVKGYPSAMYQKFTTRHDADMFVRGGGGRASELRVRSVPTISKLTVVDKSSSCETKIGSSIMNDMSLPPRLVSKFEEYSTDNGFVHIYTDGSSLGNGQNGAKAGIGAYFGPNDVRNVSEPLRLMDQAEKPTNQKAEIQAVTESLKRVSSETDVLILTDSQYVCKAMTLWMTQWLASGFKNVQNAEYFISLNKLVTSRKGQTVFKYVPAHSGLHGNECADKLAKMGAEQMRFLD